LTIRLIVMFFLCSIDMGVESFLPVSAGFVLDAPNRLRSLSISH
jgi:hypothetical protein